jgi:hypothetical protein
MLKDKSPMPLWLERANRYIEYGSLEHFTLNIFQVDIKEILKESCFYLSAGADITPIVAFKDLIYSYVLCDINLCNSLKRIEDRLYGIIVTLKDRLRQQGFTEIQKFKVDKRFLGIDDFRYPNGYLLKLDNSEISFWNKDGKIYSVLYLNYDNLQAYKALYIKNNIMPKAICEILPDGGSLCSNLEDQSGRPTLTVKEKRNLLPEYGLGHMDSIGDRNQYDLITRDVQYFGDYGSASSSSAMQIFKRIN